MKKIVLAKSFAQRLFDNNCKYQIERYSGDEILYVMGHLLYFIPNEYLFSTEEHFSLSNLLKIVSGFIGIDQETNRFIKINTANDTIQNWDLILDKFMKEVDIKVVSPSGIKIN